MNGDNETIQCELDEECGRTARDIVDALSCAETCETDEDLVANLEEALHNAKVLVDMLKTTLYDAKENTRS